MKAPKIECKRCGLCCIIYNPETKTSKWCKYLITYLDRKTRCLIYPHRYLACLEGGQVCLKRAQTQYDYPKCPYNTDKPIHPYYINYPTGGK